GGRGGYRVLGVGEPTLRDPATPHGLLHTALLVLAAASNHLQADHDRGRPPCGGQRGRDRVAPHRSERAGGPVAVLVETDLVTQIHHALVEPITGALGVAPQLRGRDLLGVLGVFLALPGAGRHSFGALVLRRIGHADVRRRLLPRTR